MPPTRSPLTTWRLDSRFSELTGGSGVPNCRCPCSRGYPSKGSGCRWSSLRESRSPSGNRLRPSRGDARGERAERDGDRDNGASGASGARSDRHATRSRRSSWASWPREILTSRDAWSLPALWLRAKGTGLAASASTLRFVEGISVTAFPRCGDEDRTRTIPDLSPAAKRLQSGPRLAIAVQGSENAVGRPQVW
jgi:hypothetical protein